MADANQNSQTPSSPDNFNMSERQLGFAYWFVSRKILLKKIGIGILIAISASFLLYGLYGFADYFFISGPKERKLISQLPKMLINPEIVYKERAQSLEILSTRLVPSSGKYDLVSKIRNPNEKWLVKFDYSFIVEGVPTEVQKGFILPNEEKFLFKLASELPRGVKTASLMLNNIRWRRIDPHQVSDYNEWKRIRFNFPISDISFDGAVRTDTKVFSQAKFKVQNFTAFDFWQVDFKVILYRGPIIVGVNFTRVDKFYVGDKEDITLIWYESIPGITRVEVLPEVNIFDEENYIK